MQEVPLGCPVMLRGEQNGLEMQHCCPTPSHSGKQLPCRQGNRVPDPEQEPSSALCVSVSCSPDTFADTPHAQPIPGSPVRGYFWSVDFITECYSRPAVIYCELLRRASESQDLCYFNHFFGAARALRQEAGLGELPEPGSLELRGRRPWLSLLGCWTQRPSALPCGKEQCWFSSSVQGLSNVLLPTGFDGARSALGHPTVKWGLHEALCVTALCP